MITYITMLLLYVAGINQNEPVAIQKGNTIHVSVDNVSSNNGRVSFTLFNKEGFLQQPIKSVYVDIKGAYE
ncbi:MAG: hypothetical protein JKY08_01755 [Flavobacteriaceae bacterium]|nr:hypothetical protein [Flavobacteriaceae bacterium]